MAALNNVVIIEQQETVFIHINTWISSHSNHSNNTAKAYESDVRLFFKTVKGKEIENLVASDLSVNSAQVLKYQTLLVDSDKYKNTSINRIINSVRSLCTYLKGMDYNVNPFAFKVVKKLKDDTKSIGFLSPDEALGLAECAFHTEQRNGLNKKAMILLSITTSIRKDATLQLKFSHIKKSEEKENMYIIESDELFDKGTMVYKELHGDIYDMLKESHGDKSLDDLIFNYSHAGVDQMFKRLLNKVGIEDGRNVSWHSLRKVGTQYVLEKFGLHAAQMQAGHKSPESTSRSYAEKKKNLAVDMYNQVDESVFDDLSRDEMLVLLRSFGNGVGSQLRQKAKEMVDKRG